MVFINSVEILIPSQKHTERFQPNLSFSEPMSGKDFSEVVELIKNEDPRYDKGAYYFVRHGLDHTLKRLKDDAERQSNHVCGQELLSGIREYALEQYGPMAHTLLQHWGIHKCDDFGEIVFNLVEFGVLGKTENDRREDFSGGYDFYDAFVVPFLPKSKRVASLPRFNREDELEATA